MNTNRYPSEEDALIPKIHSRDRFNLVYFIIFCTGIGTLIPWNYFITAKQYFLFQLSRNGSGTASHLEPFFENYLTLFSMIPIALTNLLNLVLRRHITPMRRFNFGVSIMFVIFLLTLVLTKQQLDPLTFFWITMVCVAILNVCSGIIQGSAMGIVSMMPGRYIKGFMEGQALSGILASISSIISIPVASSPDNSAFVYFFLALVILVFAGIGFCTLKRITFSREFVLRSMTLDSSFEVQVGDADINTEPESLPRTQVSFIDKYRPLIGRIKWNALSVTMTYLVTLSLFPAISSNVKSYSRNPTWRDVYFMAVTNFLFFNLADYLGRFLCGFVNFPSKDRPKTLFFMTLLRWAIVPLYFLCNVHPKMNFPTIFDSDAYPIALIWLLGVSNGYLVTLSLVYAPSLVHEKEREAVGTLMSLFLCLGLGLGVSVSFLYNYII